MLLALAAALAFALTRAPPEVRLGRRVQLTLDQGLEIDPALSPDGKLTAYAAGPLGATRLYVRQVDGGASVAITAEGGVARRPRWSPDGSRLVFRSGRGLEIIPALGGTPRLLVAAPPDDWLPRCGYSYFAGAWGVGPTPRGELRLSGNPIRRSTLRNRGSWRTGS